MDTEQWYWRAPDGRVINQQAYLSSTFAELVKLSRMASRIMAAVYDRHFASRLRWKLSQINGIWCVICYITSSLLVDLLTITGLIFAIGVRLYEKN
jgi:hypothetical protein